jgi:threonine dehydrogenase-like Zn-dependent dehydrogenase
MATEGNEIVPLLDPEHDPGNTTTKNSSMSGNMKAVHYEGAFEVSVKEIEVPKIQHPDDAIIKVTTAGQTFKVLFCRTAADKCLAICGSDLHMYQGRTAADKGLVFGHENMGIIIETGEGVTLLEKGDRIVLPFNVADGRCRNCEEGKTAFCTG